MYLYNAIVHTITPSIPFSVNYLLIAFAGLIVCAVSLLLLSYFVIVPLKLGFYRTLDLKDLFDFKKASVLRCEKKKLYFEYFLCLIIIGALTGAMASILGQFGQIVSVIAACFVSVIQVLLIPNLNGQIINKNIDDVDEDDSAYDENDEYYEDEEYYDDTNG